MGSPAGCREEGGHGGRGRSAGGIGGQGQEGVTTEGREHGVSVSSRA
jgi:hypothetical protein